MPRETQTQSYVQDYGEPLSRYIAIAFRRWGTHSQETHSQQARQAGLAGDGEDGSPSGPHPSVSQCFGLMRADGTAEKGLSNRQAI